MDLKRRDLIAAVDSKNESDAMDIADEVSAAEAAPNATPSPPNGIKSDSSADNFNDDFTGEYELMGVVTHKGRSADSGHYIGWVRQGPGSDYWWRYDDDIVTEVATAEILNLKGGGDWHTAYLNFYRFKE